jgi:osmotically inducible lipoprotein OsmB
MRNLFLLLAAAGAITTLSACGHTTEQKAASGAVAGAVVGGPVGAAVGGAAGAALGKVTDETKK